MSWLGAIADDKSRNDRATWLQQLQDTRDRNVQIAISVVFGLSAFMSFCVLRPKWTELYNARKKQATAASRLPELPKTLFGWIPIVYRISNAEVLASAGLDAYAFLSFFRYATRYLSVTLFFSLTVILPVNFKYTKQCPPGFPSPFCGNSTTSPRNDTSNHTSPSFLVQDWVFLDGNDSKKKLRGEADNSYMWMYVVFIYLFTAVAIYLMIDETKNMIRIRQAYLGTQSTVTDKTIRLSGIPVGMRSEDKIRDFIESLAIGQVDSVMLCRNWRRLDRIMGERMRCLRKLEEAWAKHLGQHRTHHRSQHNARHDISDGVESTALLSNSEVAQDNATLVNKPRPTYTVKHGFMPFQGTKVDAIDHFEEQLRMLDGRIHEMRQEKFEPASIAFITMESTAASQMAVQAILDPVPGQLIASLAPPPADVVWSNTYLSRNTRMIRSWVIMVLIGFLSVFWAVLLLPLAGLTSDEALDAVGLKKKILEEHQFLRSLLQTGLPTLMFSLLAIAVPYVYDWLSNSQGMTSQGDIEMSLISKNFFFTFFNLFIVFTIWGSAASLIDVWDQFRDLLRDTTAIAFAVASSLQRLTPFYVNLIILQGLGLLPFRLLELGSVALYPIYLINARTPRDHAELSKAPVFSYGYYLPQTMLIFVICIVYSVLPSSWLITLFGLIYFWIGGFIYKYQLLYAMDHRQYSTGRAWPLICNRIIMGLVVFHIAMAGFMALRTALAQSVAILPLIIFTIWFTVYFQRTYFPLMKFIALRNVGGRDIPTVMPTPSQSAWDRDTDHGRLVDTDPETGLRYMNPNLTSPLEPLWIRKAGRSRIRQIA